VVSRDALLDWLARQPPQTIEVAAGLLARPVLPARLDGSEVAPGEPLRAGGYGEDRDVYRTPLFAPADGTEPRSLHLGIDVFAPAGTAVAAALDGRVHSLADNRAAGDYGPTVILEHEPEPGLVFLTLYGHLARAGLGALRPGQAVARGAAIGALGDRHENGGWPPHLHFQLIRSMTDPDGRSWSGDFPGVCRRSEQARWLTHCPDPSRLLGLA
jgi:murein DD-endopeptidase MepM/ murein hydrolase activator NlpD